MVGRILETEQALDALLPLTRLTEKPSADLLSAAKAWSSAVWQQAEALGPMPLSQEQMKQGIILSENAVFICGVHRSGTTLVRDLLDGHPELLVLPSEGTYYTNLEARLQKLPEQERMTCLGKEWLRRLANPVNQPPYWLLGNTDLQHSPYVAFARYFMAWWPVADHRKLPHWPHTAVILAYASAANKLNAKCWVDKSPTNEQFLNRIWNDLPKAKIIHIVRNPYAVVSSRRKMEPAISLKSVLKDLSRSYQIAASQSALNDAQFMLVRYEDVCEDTSRFIEKLTACLNIQPDPSLLSSTVAGIPVQANSSFTSGIAGEIIPAGHYNRPEMLSDKEKKMLEAYLQSSGRKIGCELARINYFQRLYIKLRYILFPAG